jgi:hypothetical protein
MPIILLFAESGILSFADSEDDKAITTMCELFTAVVSSEMRFFGEYAKAVC